MPDWSVIASFSTAAGTLALAVATFASVRSFDRGARATERALLAAIRPVLVPSRPHDPPERISFSDDHWVEVAGGHGIAEATDEVVYLAIALRNVGDGLAILDRWDFHPERPDGAAVHDDPDGFRRLTRDIYVPSGDIGFWQGTFRDPSESEFKTAHEAIRDRQPLTIDLLYGDSEGGQRTISRFTLVPGDDGEWKAAASRHWHLDREDPR